MLEILRSLSLRFYTATLLALIAIFAGLFIVLDRGLVLAWVPLTLLGVLVFLIFICLLSLAFWLFYRALGTVFPTPSWRAGKLERQPRAVTVTRVEDPTPYWATGSPAPYAGTLRRFIEQHQGVIPGDDTKLRIAIVLSGGGAKGIYQAGALRALWDFLREEEALQYVRVVTGTSIGTWNAMFWLTDQVGDGTIEDWWLSAEPRKMVGPTFYKPLYANYVLQNEPWQAQFDEIFGERVGPILEGKQPYFYFTRTNVRRARLEYTTNRSPEYRYARLTEAGYEPAKGVIDENIGRHRVTDRDDLRRAVFTSMDIPPAFKRMRGPTGDECEDGGVIDNLPIRYATRYEGANLMFVLPLNATFEAKPSRRSMALRMARVMDIRQGALERAAIRDISLYNELINAGRNRELDIHIKPVTTVCLCPEPPLDVGTFAFWRTRTFGPDAFALMYEAMRAELRRFDFSPGNNEVWMSRVAADGSIAYSDFTLK